jgi:hypothetical protein
MKLDIQIASAELQKFYETVDLPTKDAMNDQNVREYYLASIQATNDRASRVRRGKAVENVLRRVAGEEALPFSSV